MPKATLIEDNEFERKYRIANGQTITLKLDEDYEEVTFWDENENQLGTDRDFLFVQDEHNDNRFLLARMYVPIPNYGLGRAALEFFIDYTDASVYARSHDGIRLNDGSHLTGDAPIFVRKMQGLGLLEKDNDEDNF